MKSLMNNTKWGAIRLAMYGLGTISPKWRVKDVNGHLSEWDRDWYYHFQIGGYDTIEFLEIAISEEELKMTVRKILAEIHVPGIEHEEGFVVYGYVAIDKFVEYIKV